MAGETVGTRGAPVEVFGANDMVVVGEWRERRR
jgi:hypothetical protein